MIKELFVEKISDLVNILAEIRQNFEKECPDSIVVKFKETISKEDMLNSLKELWQFEIDSDHTIDILIKNLSYDYRKEALRLALQTENLKNPIFLANVFFTMTMIENAINIAMIKSDVLFLDSIELNIKNGGKNKYKYFSFVKA